VFCKRKKKYYKLVNYEKEERKRKEISDLIVDWIEKQKDSSEI
jgi:hypothetical protein